MTTSIVIGISGATCSGKTTLATSLYNFFKSHFNVLFHNKNMNSIHFVIEDCYVISQDDYFLPVEDIRHKKVFGLNHLNWERLGALDMEKMIADLENLKEADNLNIVDYNNESNDQQSKILKLRIILVEGFLILGHSKLCQIMQIKFHLHVPVEKCYERRVKRIYNPPDILGYFEMCVWPSYLEYYSNIKLMADIIELNGIISNNSLFVFARDFILEKMFEVLIY